MLLAPLLVTVSTHSIVSGRVSSTVGVGADCRTRTSSSSVIFKRIAGASQKLATYSHEHSGAQRGRRVCTQAQEIQLCGQH